MKIALLGAESTGKSTLAHALAAQLNHQGHRAEAVDEYLRSWCDEHQRTPRIHEQASIADEQHQRIERAAGLEVSHGVAQSVIVIADTTPLMTAVYSDYVFGDTSLYAAALVYQRSFDLTLLTGLDVAWLPDGIQRDGPHVRNAVDALLRGILDTAAIPYSTVYGQDAARVACAFTFVNGLFASKQPLTAPSASPANGLTAR